MQSWWNFNHLMLFYRVAQHGGISAALPHVGYSIQQPALSAQLIALERQVGEPLFIRRPFQLTPAGTYLFAKLQEGLGPLEEALLGLSQSAGPLLRIGAPHFVTARYLAGIAHQIRRSRPACRFAFQCGTDAQLLDSVRQGRLDVAVVIAEQPPHDLPHLPLLELPIALLVPHTRKKLVIEDLLPGGEYHRPLVCPTVNAAICRPFDAELKRRGLTWRPELAVSSVADTCSMVAAGNGIGLGVVFSSLLQQERVSAVPLHDVSRVRVLATWRRSPPAILDEFVAAIQHRARMEGPVGLKKLRG